MKLEYIKLNNILYQFDKDIIIFMGEENSGKTSIYHLIRFIYGMEYKKDTNLMKALKSIAKKDSEYRIKWKFINDKCTYNYNLKENKITYDNNKFYTLTEYSKHIIEKYRYYSEVLGIRIKHIGNFSFDYNVAQKINSTQDYSKFFFDRNSSTYTVICFLKLINENTIAKHFNNYYGLVGRKKNIIEAKKRNNKIIKTFSSDITNFYKQDDVSSAEKYIQLSKLQNDILDEDYIKEIEVLCNNISGYNVDSVIKFHEELVTSYNQVIDKKRKEIEEENDAIRKLNKQELKEIVQYHNVNKEYNNALENIKVDIEIEKEELYSLNTKVLQINNELKNYCKEFSELFNLNKEFANEIKINENYASIDLRCENNHIETIGDSNVVTNFLSFLTYTFLKSEFPIMIFEKEFFGENRDKIKVRSIRKVSEEIKGKNKQCYFFLHPETQLKNLEKEEYNVIKSKSFFNITF